QPTRRCGMRMSMQSREMPLEVAFLSTSSEVSPPRTRRHKSPVSFDRDMGSGKPSSSCVPAT
uniref:Uncharacterized protein n=1 Tax=Aegilops tauschii subsp. strangulata TaxID=200361 RepID=A0A453QR07_AEGTS